MPLYNSLKEYRARLGINQQELGKRVGASRQTISLIERGDYFCNAGFENRKGVQRNRRRNI